MKLIKIFLGTALMLLPFSSSYALSNSSIPIPAIEEKPWVQTSFQGFSVFAPVVLQKQDFALPAEQQALFHSVETYMGQADQYVVYSMFMHMKNGLGNLQGSLNGSIQNVVTQLQGTDFQLDFLEQNNQKNSFLATGTFTRGTDKMIVKGYAYTDQKGKIYVLTIFGNDNLKTDNASTRILTSIKVQ